MPDWKGSDRKSRLPSDWPRIRTAVLVRDRYRCQHERADTGALCLAKARDVDHIHGDDDHRMQSLQSLCGYHHDQKSGREGGIASGKARREARDKKKKPHAGYL